MPTWKERKEKKHRGELQTPEQEILTEVAHRQWVDQYDQVYKDKFVDGFLENALQEGYAIELNDDMEVINIRKVPHAEGHSEFLNTHFNYAYSIKFLIGLSLNKAPAIVSKAPVATFSQYDMVDNRYFHKATGLYHLPGKFNI